MKLIPLLALFISTLTFAIPEQGFERNWKEKVLPYFQSMHEEELQNAQGLKIKFFYLTRETNKKTLLIIPGRTEPTVKYAELIYDFKNLGYDIFILDHQGQGESDRLLADSHKGHVIHFDDYVKDLGQFYSRVKEIKNNQITHLIAHSMGGAIAVKFMSHSQWAVNKAVLMAPMLKLNTAPYSEFVARLYSTVLVKIKKGDEYAPDRGPYIPEEDVFEGNSYTHSEGRFNITKFIFTNWPHLAVGGPTTRWVNESLKATKKIHKAPFATPVLLFQAGQDEIVKNERQNAFCRDFCKLILLPEARHEILMEKDEIRTPVLHQIKSFFGI